MIQKANMRNQCKWWSRELLGFVTRDRKTEQKKKKNLSEVNLLNSERESMVYSNQVKTSSRKDPWNMGRDVYFLQSHHSPQCADGLKDSSPHAQCGHQVSEEADKILFPRNCVCLFWPYWGFSKELLQGTSFSSPHLEIYQDWVGKRRMFSQNIERWTWHCGLGWRVTVWANNSQTKSTGRNAKEWDFLRRITSLKNLHVYQAI